MSRRLTLSLLLSLGLLARQAHADAHKGPPVVVGQTFMAGSQDPTAGSTGWALTS